MSYESLWLDESSDAGTTRLVVRGELDLSTADQLRARLRQLLETGSRVRLDLSNLEFLDCAGARVLIEELARAKGRLLLEPNVSRPVTRLIEAMNSSGWTLDF